jgi:hypothetical protein
MKDSEKLVMILEKTGSTLEVKDKDSGGYVLEGIFAQFGVLNNNKRIYEEKEYLPHLDYLQDKIKKRMLFGELDHPKEFDISLKNVSHAVESLEYDKENRQIRGKIRLVNTEAGKNAMALVDAGFQLSISSRAAGVVKENNTVEIKKIFAYDLVAEPGFSNAQLNKINESFGLSNDDENIAIYDVSNLYENKFDFYSDNEEKNIKNMNNTNLVTTEMMEKYTTHIKEQYESLMEKINNNKETPYTINKDIKENLDNINHYLSEFSSNYKKFIDYNDSNVESYNKDKNNVEGYLDHVRENVSNVEGYLDHVHENVSNVEGYLNHVNENVNNLTDYTEYQSNYVNNLIKHNNYLVENINNLIKFTDYLTENVNNIYEHNNYLTENMNNVIEYVEYIKDGINESNISTNKVIESQSNNLNVSLNENFNNSENLISKIDSLIESVKKQKTEDVVSKANFPYFKLLNESKQREFLLLPNNQKTKIIEEVIKSKPMNEADFISIWNETLNPIDESKQKEYLVSMMPENYKSIWEKLDENSKNRIFAQATYYNLSTPYQIKAFWETRPKLNEAVEFVKLNETVEYSEKVKSTYGSSYMNQLALGLKRLS